MEFNKTENSLYYLKNIHETSVEQSVDTEFSLPDYYPEISKILKCLADVNVMSSQCGENGVNIGGQVAMTVLYTDPEGQINSFSHTYPFSKNIDFKGADGAFADVLANVNYLNTKAMGPRKIEIHGSVALAVTVNGVQEKIVISEIDCDDVYAKRKGHTVTMPLQTVNKGVFLEDDIVISQTKPSVAKILRSNAVAKISECKVIGEKMVVKGDVELEILYCPPQNGRPVLIKEERGFSQMVECSYKEAEIGFDAFATVCAFELRPKTSLDGEVRNIAFEAKINIDFHPFVTKTIEFVSDIISCRYNADIGLEGIVVEDLLDRFSENFVCKKNIDYSGGVLSDIYDVWCKPCVEFVTADGQDILVRGNVLVNILGCDSDSETVLIERNIEFEHRHSCPKIAELVRCKPSVFVAAVNTSLNSDATLDIAVELNISATVFSCDKVDAVTIIKIGDAPIQKDNGTAVVLYFAEDETVWQVAKKYTTSPDALCKVNNIESVDTVCNKMLLIPIV